MQVISIEYRGLVPRRSYLVMNYSWAMSAPTKGMELAAEDKAENNGVCLGCSRNSPEKT